MADLLRDNPVLVLAAVIAIFALFALPRRWRRGGDVDPRRARRAVLRVEPEEEAEDRSRPSAKEIERARRRARIQMILALFAIVGFTLIALINTFRGDLFR
ncbi:MAG: hypothetical protein NXI21_13415 [Alphaproteobacteria bacterium]|nr:hypothetical protein [Alphaproteobacteria bacterium]